MSENNFRTGKKLLCEYPKNLAIMLNSNADRFGESAIYQQPEGNSYQQLSWRSFRQNVARIQDALVVRGLKPGDRVAILSPNRRELLEIEHAIMAMGGISVPIFAGYPSSSARPLLAFCEPRFVIVADKTQFEKLESPDQYDLIIHFDQLGGECDSAKNIISFSSLLTEPSSDERISGEEIPADSICLMMFTSGTMGKPKCVQLTHGNILSQQAAMHELWQLSDKDRFLSYLPWHHSFGGIYEKYAAIYNGAVLSLESGFGKDIDLLIENWERVKPTVFFSVPRVYQQIMTLVMGDPAIERIVFHDDLRFVFTAAAPLPKTISDLFAKRNIPVYEGWGLTETSPCCTITDPAAPRDPGVVGKPIAGVSLRLTDEGEIQVKGPNVMKGYFHNKEATTRVLSQDGWFSTGDVGKFTENGLRLISRKDRIFKLSNAEKVMPAEIENLIVEDCSFLSHAFLTGNGYDHPVVLLFPNKSMFAQRPDKSKLKENCDCPGGIKDLSHCLTHCLKHVIDGIDPKYARPQAAMLIDHELSMEREELTPSMKLAPNVVGRIYKAKIERLYDDTDCVDESEEAENVYILDLEN